jgi:hypothetical protein
MMRRITLVAASAAMLALSALPASAATMGSATATAATHKLSFPGLSGVKAWGNYAKVSRGIKVNVCAETTKKGIFAVGAVTEAFNSTGKLHTNLGAVSIGYHQTVCRSMTLRYSAHLKVYTFTANNKGMINHQTKMKKVF